MKCPVCSGEHPGLVCQRCGFDSSRDYKKYPTFGPVGRVPALSALKKEWNRQQDEVEDPPPGDKTRRRMLWFTLAACTVTLILGIAIGTGLGGGRPDPTEPPESIQLQTPAETTEPEAIVQVHALRSDVPPLNGNGFVETDQAKTYAVFGSDYRREEIGSVRFLTTLADAPADAWDVSQAGDGSVLAWVVPGGGLYDLHIGAEGAILAPENCQGLFAGYANVRSIEFGTEFRTDQVQTMKEMFDGCSSLTELELSSFDTSKVTDMYGMFDGCSSLTELELSSFNTSRVTDMRGMFEDCSSLTDLGLSSFDTSSVTDMRSMFSGCSSLTELTLSSFDTASVTRMDSMFSGCSSLTELELSSFDTSSVTSMWMMFSGCSSLTELELSSFDTSSVTNMGWMFDGCSSLTELELSSFDTSNVTDMYRMFDGCSSLTDLDLSSFNTSSVTDMLFMFYDCPAGDDWQHLIH